MPEHRNESDGLHANPAGSCPWTVYLYMTGGELRFFPDSITIQHGDGVVWKPLVLAGGVTVGRFTVRFPDGSPFELDEFDESRQFSGRAKRAGTADRPFSYDVRVGDTWYRGLKVILRGAPVGALRRKTVMVGEEDGKTVVDRPKIGIWRGTDEVVWKGRDSNIPIKVEFKEHLSPFDDDQFQGHTEVHSKKIREEVEARTTWHYTVTYGTSYPLDPDVEVDPPGDGG